MQYPDLQVVDEHDNPIGQGQYHEVRRAGKFYRAAGVLVMNSRDEVLLQQRGASINEPGKWDISAGGGVDAGEEYDQTALRELREEIGISGITLERLGKHLSDFTENGVHVRRFATIFLARYDGELKADQHEVVGLKWVGLSELDAWIARSPNDFAREMITAFHTYLKPTMVQP